MPHDSQSQSKPLFIRSSIHGFICSPGELQPISAPSPLLFSRLLQASILSSTSTTSVWPRRKDVCSPHPNVPSYCISQRRGPSTKTLIHLCHIKLSNSSFVPCKSLQTEFTVIDDIPFINIFSDFHELLEGDFLILYL